DRSDREQARSALLNAETILKQKQDELEQLKKLVAANQATKAQYERAVEDFNKLRERIDERKPWAASVLLGDKSDVDVRIAETEVKTAAADLDKAEAHLKLRHEESQRLTKLRELGTVSKEEVDRALALLAAAEADVKKSRALLERAKVVLDSVKAKS